jgi:hypothetical protein
MGGLYKGIVQIRRKNLSGRHVGEIGKGFWKRLTTRESG